MKLYHISSNDLNGKILQPKIPSNILTKIGAEDNKTPRVSFAPTIDHALLAIGFNRLKSGPKLLNVYEPTAYKNIVTDKQLDSKGFVPDANKTKEHWITKPVRLKYVGKIRLIKPSKKFVEVRAGSIKLKNYYWEYKVIVGDLE